MESKKTLATLSKKNRLLKISKILAKDVFSSKAQIFKDNHVAKTVGEYYRKHLKSNEKE